MTTLARAIAVLGAVSVIGTATQVAKGKLGAELLGAAGVGVLSQLTTLYSLLFVIAGLGFFNGMMRQITEAVKDGDGSQARAQMNSVTLFLGAASLIITVGCIAGSAWISDLLFGDGGARAPYVALVVLAVPIAVQQRVFRAFLNATRDLRAISRAQVAADVGSVVLFAIGAWMFGIWGAIFAFIGMHALLCLGMVTFAVRSGGVGLALPDLRRFSWAEIVPNFGYGANGLIMTAVASGTMIMVTRMAISHGGLAEAGIFSVAFKIATVYLGALYAAAGAYYFPTLVRISDTRSLEQEANQAVALYMAILPPVIVGLIVFGDFLIPLLFSEEFRPAVIVMSGLLFGDIFRVASETMGLTLLARRHLLPYTSLYLVYAAGFVGLAGWLIPTRGLTGIAIAYVAMHTANFIFVLVACHRSLGIRLTREGLQSFALAILVVGPTVFAEFLGATLLTKFAVAAGTGLLWLALSWRLPEFSRLRAAAQRGLRLQ